MSIYIQTTAQGITDPDGPGSANRKLIERATELITTGRHTPPDSYPTALGQALGTIEGLLQTIRDLDTGLDLAEARFMRAIGAVLNPPVPLRADGEIAVRLDHLNGPSA